MANDDFAALTSDDRQLIHHIGSSIKTFGQPPIDADLASRMPRYPDVLPGLIEKGYVLGLTGNGPTRYDLTPLGRRAAKWSYEND